MTSPGQVASLTVDVRDMTDSYGPNRSLTVFPSNSGTAKFLD